MQENIFVTYKSIAKRTFQARILYLTVRIGAHYPRSPNLLKMDTFVIRYFGYSVKYIFPFYRYLIRLLRLAKLRWVERTDVIGLWNTGF